MKDIEVRYIDGFSKEEFEILKEIDGIIINNVINSVVEITW